MKPALIKLSQKIIIHKEATGEPFRRIFNNTYKILADNLKYSGYESWSELKKDQYEMTQLNEVIAQFAEKTFLRHSLTELELDKRLFRTLPKTGNVRAEVIDIGISSDSSYRLALYLLSDVLTLIDSLGDVLLLAVDDKSKELKEKTEFDVFTITQKEDYTIDKYTAII